MSEQDGWDSSAEAWIRCVDEGDANRNHLLDPVMLNLCGELDGHDVLDLGCGEGRFARMVAARGAAVTGIDPTESLIAAARIRHPDGNYLLGRAEELPFRDESFDLVISYVTLVDIEGYAPAIREMARVLRPGGAIVIANLCGFATATPHYWLRDEAGQKRFWTLDNYMTEVSRWEAWRGIRIRNWHRPLSAYMKALLASRLMLEHFDEPIPSEEQLAAAPGLADALRKPDFCVMRWRKPVELNGVAAGGAASSEA